MNKKSLALFPVILATAMAGSQVIDWGKTNLDLGIGSHTYKHIHHRSQPKLRRLTKRRRHNK